MFRICVDMKPLQPTLQRIVCTSLSFSLSDASRRYYVEEGSISLLVEPFLSEYGLSGTDFKARRKAAANALVELLSSFSGLIAFTSDITVLRSLVQALRIPNFELQVSASRLISLDYRGVTHVLDGLVFVDCFITADLSIRSSCSWDQSICEYTIV